MIHAPASARASSEDAKLETDERDKAKQATASVETDERDKAKQATASVDERFRCAGGSAHR